MLEAATCVQSFVYLRDVLGIELHTEMVLPILKIEKRALIQSYLLQKSSPLAVTPKGVF